MLRCPTCGAREIAGTSCHRCRTDLRQVLAVEQAAVQCRRRAAAALASGCGDRARALADRACALHRCHASVSLRAAVALADGEFDLALRLWREVRTGPPDNPAPATARASIAPSPAVPRS